MFYVLPTWKSTETALAPVAASIATRRIRRICGVAARSAACSAFAAATRASERDPSHGASVKRPWSSERNKEPRSAHADHCLKLALLRSRPR
eukprot:1586194-Pleurochrysis_carterae.AAC.7